jgi:hypothetical protein
MNILSPYGKDPLTELKDVYKLSSFDELLGRAYRHLEQSYGFSDVAIEYINIAFGMAIKFTHSDSTYFLKFTGRANHNQPQKLFELLNYLRLQGVPVAENVPMSEGGYFKNILDHSPYDVTYLMREAKGTLITEITRPRLQQYIETMTTFHRVGLDYQPRVFANQRGLKYFLSDAVSIFEEIQSLSEEQNAWLKSLLGYIESSFERVAWGKDLSKSHIHWDFRFCHVLFDEGGVSGIIDPEQATFAERLFDVVIGIVSHSDPARALLLNHQEILEGLHLYNLLYPFSQSDRKALKAMILCALYNELAGKILFLSTGVSDTQEQDVETLWAALEYFYGLPEDLRL